MVGHLYLFDLGNDIAPSAFIAGRFATYLLLTIDRRQLETDQDMQEVDSPTTMPVD